MFISPTCKAEEHIAFKQTKSLKSTSIGHLNLKLHYIVILVTSYHNNRIFGHLKPQEKKFWSPQITTGVLKAYYTSCPFEQKIRCPPAIQHQKNIHESPFVHPRSSFFLLLVFAVGLAGKLGTLLLVPIAGLLDPSFLGVSVFLIGCFFLIGCSFIVSYESISIVPADPMLSSPYVTRYTTWMRISGMSLDLVLYLVTKKHSQFS